MSSSVQPKNYLLTDFMIWVTLKIITKLSYNLVGDDTGISAINQCSNGAFGLVLPWFFGAIYSGIPLFSYGAIAAYIILFFAIYFKKSSTAKSLLWAILILNILTIWVESYLTLFFRPDSVSGYCDYAVNFALLAFSIPLVTSLVTSLDIFFTVLRVLLTFSVMKEVERITNSKNSDLKGKKSDYEVSQHFKSVFIALCLSLFWFGYGGYIYLGQRIKGVIATIISIVSLLFLALGESEVFFTVYVLGIIDTYRLAQRNNNYRKVRGWEICFNLYTVVLATLVGLTHIHIIWILLFLLVVR